MRFELRYTPGTRYGDAFPSWRFGQRRTFEAADATRMQCAHPDSIEVVECGESSTLLGESAVDSGSGNGTFHETMVVAKRESIRGNGTDSLAPSTGTSRERT